MRTALIAYLFFPICYKDIDKTLVCFSYRYALALHLISASKLLFLEEKKEIWCILLSSCQQPKHARVMISPESAAWQLSGYLGPWWGLKAGMHSECASRLLVVAHPSRATPQPSFVTFLPGLDRARRDTPSNHSVPNCIYHHLECNVGAGPPNNKWQQLLLCWEFASLWTASVSFWKNLPF